MNKLKTGKFPKFCSPSINTLLQWHQLSDAISSLVQRAGKASTFLQPGQRTTGESHACTLSACLSVFRCHFHSSSLSGPSGRCIEQMPVGALVLQEGEHRPFKHRAALALEQRNGRTWRRKEPKSSLIITKPLAWMLLKRSSLLFRMTQHEAEDVFHVVTTSLRETGRSSQTLSSSEEEL